MKEPDILEQFEIWWSEEGSSYDSRYDGDCEEHTKKKCMETWLNGADTAMQNLIDAQKKKVLWWRGNLPQY